MIHFYLFWGAQEEKDMLIIGFGHRGIEGKIIAAQYK